MAEHPNASLLRRGFEAFDRGDMATLTELFAENVVWHVPGDSQVSGEHRGRDAVFAVFAKVGELSGGTFKVELHDVLANDEHAAALTRSTGSREGKQLNSLEAAVYHMANGKVTEFWFFAEDQRLTDEFWS